MMCQKGTSYLKVATNQRKNDQHKGDCGIPEECGAQHGNRKSTIELL